MHMSVISYSPFWWKGKNYDVDVSLKVTANMVNMCVWSTWLFASFVFCSWLILIWKWRFTIRLVLSCKSKRSLEDTVMRDRTGNVSLSLPPRLCSKMEKAVRTTYSYNQDIECSRLLCNPGLHTVIISNWRAAIFFAFSLYGQGKH